MPVYISHAPIVAFESQKQRLVTIPSGSTIAVVEETQRFRTIPVICGPAQYEVFIRDLEERTFQFSENQIQPGNAFS